MDLVLNLEFIKEYYIWRVQMLVDLSLEMQHFVLKKILRLILPMFYTVSSEKGCSRDRDRTSSFLPLGDVS